MQVRTAQVTTGGSKPKVSAVYQVAQGVSNEDTAMYRYASVSYSDFYVVVKEKPFTICFCYTFSQSCNAYVTHPTDMFFITEGGKITFKTRTYSTKFVTLYNIQLLLHHHNVIINRSVFIRYSERLEYKKNYFYLAVGGAVQ